MTQPDEGDIWKAQKSSLWAMKVSADQLSHDNKMRREAQERERAATNARWEKRKRGRGAGSNRPKSGGWIIPVLMAVALVMGWQIITGAIPQHTMGNGLFLIVFAGGYFAWRIRRFVKR